MKNNSINYLLSLYAANATNAEAANKKINKPKY